MNIKDTIQNKLEEHIEVKYIEKGENDENVTE